MPCELFFLPQACGWAAANRPSSTRGARATTVPCPQTIKRFVVVFCCYILAMNFHSLLFFYLFIFWLFFKSLKQSRENQDRETKFQDKTIRDRVAKGVPEVIAAGETLVRRQHLSHTMNRCPGTATCDRKCKGLCFFFRFILSRAYYFLFLIFFFFSFFWFRLIWK